VIEREPTPTPGQMMMNVVRLSAPDEGAESGGGGMDRGPPGLMYDCPSGATGGRVESRNDEKGPGVVDRAVRCFPAGGEFTAKKTQIKKTGTTGRIELQRAARA